MLKTEKDVQIMLKIVLNLLALLIFLPKVKVFWKKICIFAPRF